jgi:putative SOS response-associated peptidase YedK
VNTCTILTTTANEVVHPIHDRMPVIVPRQACVGWLEAGTPAALAPYPAEDLEGWVVSKWVNSPRFDDAACLEPV